MHRKLSLCGHTGRIFLRYAAAVLVALAMLPPYVARAQDDVAQPPLSTIPSLAEQLANAPRLEVAAIPEGEELPPGVTAEEAARMPDRTRYAVIDYRVEGDTVHATVQLPASQTAYIASGQPNTNYGGSDTVNLGWDQNMFNAMRTLIQFDLSPLPSNAQINSATFYIYQSYINPPGDGSSMDFRAQYMQQSWSAGSVTWNNANYLGGQSLPLGSIPPVVGWIAGGATDVVKAWDSGQPNNGLIITGDETSYLGRWRQFYSRSIQAFRPYIQVDYSANCDTAPPVATMGALPSFEPNEFLVSWSAYDPDQPGCKASGVAWYNVRYRINGGSWNTWKNQSTATSNHFKGWAPNNGFVEFQVQAADRAGNLGSWSPIVSTRVDSEAPVASVNPLPDFTVYPSFTVTWSGTDNLSGIKSYSLQVNKNNTGWQTLLEDTTATSFQVTGGVLGDAFEFRVQATDNVGNVQPWSPNAQASTLIFDQPISIIVPFDPEIIKPTSPITDVIPVNWVTFKAPDTTIKNVEIRYRYTPFSGATGAWTVWQTTPDSEGAADFDYKAANLGNGLYEFAAFATNTLDQKQTYEVANSVILDLNDVMQPVGYFPFIANTVAD